MKEHSPQLTLQKTLDSRRLLAFFLAGETRSFSVAAKKMNLVPSAISHAIHSLEEEIGRALFKRSGSQVLLTKEGLRLLPMAKEILDSMSSFCQFAELLPCDKKHLSVVIPEIIYATLLPKILKEFKSNQPLVHIEIIPFQAPKNPWELFESHNADLILTTTPQEKNAPFIQRKLFSEKIYGYAAPDHDLLKQKTVQPKDLQNQLLLYPNHVILERFEALYFKEKREPSLHYNLQSIQSVCELARNNLGIGIMPTWAATPYLQDQSLQRIYCYGPELERQWSIHWRDHISLSWSAEFFIELICKTADSFDTLNASLHAKA